MPNYNALKSHKKKQKIWTHMSPEFESKLHPELARRVKFVIQDLVARGWHPVIPELYGVVSTGYRSVSDQLTLKAKHPARTSVKFSFHNVTDKKGNPQSMAVHITDRDMPKRYDKNHPFAVDLELICQRHGLRTGNQWIDPWDPLHVQLYENDQKDIVQRGGRPPFLNAQLTLLPPQFKINSPGYYLPPRSIDNFMAGERFMLQSNYPNNNLYRSFDRLRLMPPEVMTNPFPHLNLTDDDSTLNLP